MPENQKTTAAAILHTIHDAHGRPIRASFTLATHPEGLDLHFESRGGAQGAANERNADYIEGLRLLLARLAESRTLILDILVDTTVTQRLGLTQDERRIQLRTLKFPARLNPKMDLFELQREICAAQRPIGRKSNAKGLGNNTKRIQLLLDSQAHTLEVLAQLLEGTRISYASIEEPTPRESHSESPSQGRQMSAVERKAIECHAMKLARTHLESSWATVTDVSANSSFDLLCESGDLRLDVEVKGTQGIGQSVILTRNEVAHARGHYPATALIIVSGIELSEKEGVAVAGGGKLRMISPWAVLDADLTPMSYELYVPENTST